MARINGSVGQRPDSYEYWIDWSESNVNVSNNTSIISATAYIKCNAHTSHENNKVSTLSINGQTFSNTLNINLTPGTTVALVSGSTTVTHNSDGSKTININASSSLPNGSGWGPLSASASADVTLTKINKSQDITNLGLKSRTVNSATFSWSSNYVRDFTAYSLNGGNWIGAGDAVTSDNKSGTFTISNLSPNTTYTIKIRLKKTSDQEWVETSTISFTTYEIAKISSVSNFEHGSNASVSITNPSGMSLNLVMKIGDSQILSRSVGAGNNAITFTDTELDNLYKKYGTGSSLTATFIVSGSGYTNSKTCTITLKR